MTIGDRVRYKAEFCRLIGVYTGDIPHAKGVITDIKNYEDVQIATVDWDMEVNPQKVNVKNLQKCR